MTRSTLDTGITRTLPDDAHEVRFADRQPVRPSHPSALDREGTPRSVERIGCGECHKGECGCNPFGVM